MYLIAKNNKKAGHNGQLFIIRGNYFNLLTAILPSAQIDEITHLNFSHTLK
jgi:hypothetical protein